MVQTFLLFDTITNEKTVKFMQRDIITSTITWHLGLLGSNNFGEYTSFSPFTLGACVYQLLPGGWGHASLCLCFANRASLPKSFHLMLYLA